MTVSSFQEWINRKSRCNCESISSGERSALNWSFLQIKAGLHLKQYQLLQFKFPLYIIFFLFSIQLFNMRFAIVALFATVALALPARKSIESFRKRNELMIWPLRTRQPLPCDRCWESGGRYCPGWCRSSGHHEEVGRCAR